jgi:hypothetical protein
MPVAKTKFGLREHFNQILETWGGVELTHVIIIETIDEMGNIIDQSRSHSTIYGLIGNPNFKGSNFSIGFLQPGDLCLITKYEYDIIISNKLTESTTRHDNIIFQGVEYQVKDIEIGYDILVPTVSHEPVICKYLLRRVIV